MDKGKLKTVEKKITSTPTEEKLSKEVELVAAEILAQQEEESIKQLTNPSAIALSTTAHNAGENVNKVKKTVKQLFTLYLTNQFVARAIQVRADTLVSRGYRIVGGDDAGQKACEELIKNSGDTNLFWQLSVNTDIAGDGFLEKIYNVAKNKITRLKHVHPLTLEFKTNKETNKIVVDNKGEPVGYVQYYVDKQGVELSKDINKDRIEHIRFNTLGDEFTGISTIQPGYDTIVRLMNMEYSAAEAAVKMANPIIVGKCNTKSPHQIAMWGTILGRINGREQVFIPQDMELDTLSPGQQNFSDYADYFLNAVVSTFGVPKSILIGESGGGNRAEAVVLSKHFYSLISSNQRYMEDFFNRIFEEYAKIANFKAPKLEFNDVAEDDAVNSASAQELFTNGIISREEARAMIGIYTPFNGTSKVDTIDSSVKKSDMEAWHPADGTKPAGSQKGVKAAQKKSEFSEVSPSTK